MLGEIDYCIFKKVQYRKQQIKIGVMIYISESN